ncbi:SpoIIIAH-like family protein [Desmospora profundinema]|uniref:Stage III sporulation protein AH n=1 Tax=Desmospora profundinema TaxID=1571184 RepID=A0ABU1IIR1_9BACL|nr:SpoIIIAH-like family protein [Desmospora profundinema]MDR6224655.1 stage III sporulation protein AH [Desmospora profundinema]
MNMNKQTVWLVTMLTLMVVLSAYYIVTGPVEPAGPAAVNDDEGLDAKVKTEEKEQPAESGKKEKEEDQTTSKEAESDYFVGYQLQRNSLRSKMTEEYMQILTDPEASEKQLSEARAKIDELMKVDKSESVMEDLIREEGFRDAVVITNENNFVDVIVQSEKMSNEQVVKLVSMVKQHMDVPAQHVSVAYRD